MTQKSQNINRDFLKTIRHLNAALIDLEEVYENDLEHNDDISADFLFSTYSKIESALYYFGRLLFEKECQTPSEDIITDCSYPDDFSETERKALSAYLSKYCASSTTPEYKLERCGSNGYKATLPYLISRRATRGMSFYPKRKYICGVFKNLLESEKSKLQKLETATVIIISYSPLGNRGLRDNDNSDAHDVINLIKDYLLLQDDSGTFLNVFYDAQESEGFYTEVYILPKFSAQNIVNFQSNISPLGKIGDTTNSKIS